jgi:amino acid adenylation domain-containing protein
VGGALPGPEAAPRAALSASTVTALFEAQAARTPAAPALVYEDRRLTYGELNARANGLAHELRRRGVGPDVPVGLYLERSPDAIAGLLGILKAGGAYLPLDAETTPERVAALLTAARAPVLVTQAGLAAAAPPGVPVVCLDGPDAPAPTRANPAPLAGPANLVYVIYTSGSTGAPKGVAVEHRQLLNYLAGILPVLDLAPGTNCALVSTLAADLGHTMLFPALCAGGCLHLIARARTTDARELAAYCAANAVDYVKIVPSHLGALLVGDEAAAILPRHTLVLGGEATGADLVAQIRRLAPGCRILNHYGPTETTVGVLTHPLPVDAPLPDGALPLGRPLAGSAVYVLDRHGQIVPPGVAGEIYIGGAGEPVRARSVRPGAGRAAVSQRRPGARPPRRDGGVSGPGGQPGENSRLPRRAGRDHGGAAPASGRGRGRGGRPAGRGEPAGCSLGPGGLRGRGRRPRARRGATA